MVIVQANVPTPGVPRPAASRSGPFGGIYALYARAPVTEVRFWRVVRLYVDGAV